jgi:hypothetical protein
MISRRIAGNNVEKVADFLSCRSTGLLEPQCTVAMYLGRVCRVLETVAHRRPDGLFEEAGLMQHQTCQALLT